ncbi:MAG: acetolactate synthase large subunit [Desulfomonilaceae bacterium]
MTGAEILMKTSVESGINVCFANFGTTELNLVHALDTVPGIRPVLCLFEGVCSGASDGYARMMDKPAITLLHLGPGLSNASANLHNARRAHSPMLNIIGEHALWHRGSDAPEVMDIETLAKPVSDWIKLVKSPDTISHDTACAISSSVHGNSATLIVPQDVQWGESENTMIESIDNCAEPVDSSKVDQIARVLRRGGRTLMVLGSRSLRARGLKAADRIRTKTACDLVSESFPPRMEKGLGIPFVNRVPYFPEPAFELFSRYDSVILVGAKIPVAFFAYKGGRSNLLTESHQMHVLGSRSQNLEEALELLADAVGARNERPTVHSTSGSGVVKPLPTGVLTAEKVCMVLAALQPEGAIIVDESVTTGFAHYELSSKAPRHDWLSITGGAIGQGMPCAIGAAIACPDRPVIDFQADGSAMYTLQSLWTQAREELNITTLICANKSYNILGVEMARSGLPGPGKAFVNLTHLDNPSINWTQLSNSLGVPAVSVRTAEDLAREFTRSLEETGPYLIEMVLAD